MFRPATHAALLAAHLPLSEAIEAERKIDALRDQIKRIEAQIATLQANMTAALDAAAQAYSSEFRIVTKGRAKAATPVFPKKPAITATKRKPNPNDRTG